MRFYCEKKIELVETSKLKEHPDNNNTHSKEQIERLAKIISQNGFTAPITVSLRTGYITKGHARLKAAKMLDLHEVPVLYLEYKDPAHEFQDLTADNEIARWAELDKDKLNEKLKKFDLEEFDVDLLGIKEFTIDDDDLDTGRDFSVGNSESPKLTILVDCFSEEERDSLLSEFNERGIKCKLDT